MTDQEHKTEAAGGLSAVDRSVSGLGVRLARDLMALGDELNSPAHRMEYKGGSYPHHERPQGGMNEAALAAFFEMKLAEYTAANGKLQPRTEAGESLPE